MLAFIPAFYTAYVSLMILAYSSPECFGGFDVFETRLNLSHGYGQNCVAYGTKFERFFIFG